MERPRAGLGPASLVSAAVAYTLVRVLDWDTGLFGLILMPLVIGGITLWAELRTARRILGIVEEGQT